MASGHWAGQSEAERREGGGGRIGEVGDEELGKGRAKGWLGRGEMSSLLHAEDGEEGEGGEEGERDGVEGEEEREEEGEGEDGDEGRELSTRLALLHTALQQHHDQQQEERERERVRREVSEQQQQHRGGGAGGSSLAEGEGEEKWPGGLQLGKQHAAEGDRVRSTLTGTKTEGHGFHPLKQEDEEGEEEEEEGERRVAEQSFFGPGWSLVRSRQEGEREVREAAIDNINGSSHARGFDIELGSGSGSASGSGGGRIAADSVASAHVMVPLKKRSFLALSAGGPGTSEEVVIREGLEEEEGEVGAEEGGNVE